MQQLNGLRAPSLEDFDVLAADAYELLPESFRALTGEVVIRIEDFPSGDVLTQMKAGEFDLLGLFQGVGLSQGGDSRPTGSLPNMVFLYRRPILDYWAEHEETLGAVISHVLIHEIGHHFGLSDDDMERLEAEVP
ncbi:MAG: metallopeptidase family protein [Parvibaculaceae bacterium]